MSSRCGLRVVVGAALLAFGAAGPAEAQPAAQQAAQAALPLAAPPDPASTARPLFRVILNDGTALVSYGEFSRVGDRVVFSMPLDSPRGDRLQLVNLPRAMSPRP
jgi:hypothetical protein